MERMTLEEYRKMMGLDSPQGPQTMKMEEYNRLVGNRCGPDEEAAKYHNEPVTVYGIRFQSHKEARRYLVLRSMAMAHEIWDLQLQVPYVLQDGFRKNGRNVQTIIYIADFVYTDAHGRTHIEDTKGFKTKDYRIKKKLFEKRYPDLTITEI